MNYWQGEFKEDYSTELCEYIKENKILNILKESKEPKKAEVKAIIDKALELKGLNVNEAAVLLQVKEQDLIEEFLLAAKKVKEKIYGKRLVIFAPLYFANKCINNCLYCGFRHDNKLLVRKKLSQEEIKNEVKALEKEGHKRLLILTGESPNTDLDYVLEGIKTAYETETENGGKIKRINVEIAPLSVDQFKKLKEAKIGTYTCFQETYHRPSYEKMHPVGPKSNYNWRLTVMDRAMEAGIDDLGIGVLFGLYDYKYEIIALLLHAQYLDKKFGVGPHTISIPRLNPALGAEIKKPPYPVSDEDFKKLVAILRLAVPYTGLILTTRESVEMRNLLFAHGVSQISAGSKTSPGAYKDTDKKEKLEQFSLYDNRVMSEIIREVASNNYIPSFCTSCYRLGRTGHNFMELAKVGKIQKFCQVNALMTFKEYLVNYGDKELKQIGEKCINNHLKKLTNSNRKLAEKIRNNIKEIEQGKYDFHL